MSVSGSFFERLRHGKEEEGRQEEGREEEGRQEEDDAEVLIATGRTPAWPAGHGSTDSQPARS